MAATTPPVLETPRLLLALPAPDAAGRMLSYYLRNREHLAPWEPERGPDFFTHEWWRYQLAENRREHAEGRGLRLAFLPREEPEGPVLGVANFTGVVRGASWSCVLGYSIDAEQQGRSLMLEGLRRGIEYVFEDWNLHRVMANHLPRNTRSARVLERLGFEREGYAREYLRIAGRWEDHVLTALTNRGWREE